MYIFNSISIIYILLFALVHCKCPDTSKQCTCGRFAGSFCSSRSTDGTGHLSGNCKQYMIYHCPASNAPATEKIGCAYCIINDPPGTDFCGNSRKGNLGKLKYGDNQCINIETIEECQAQSGCGWCNKPDYCQPKNCDTIENLKDNECENDIIDGEDHEITDPSPDNPPPPIGVEPGQTKNITLRFTLQAHPVDLYYLMDFSGSMGGDKSNLIKIATELKNTIGNISEDYQLGLGSFVDKPISPLGGPTDYVFKNRMSLTHETEDFASIVANTDILYGGDNYEGLGEALLQAAVCQNQINWRNNSRRIILLATDNGFHTEGDGKVVGINKTNDGRCYLNADGDYTAELDQDYPSIDQLKTVLEDNSMNTIFAVRYLDRYKVFYQDIQSKIKATSLSELENNSENILQLIKEAYSSMNNRFELDHTESIDELNVRFYSTCQGSGELETNICDNLNNAKHVEFIASIDLEECPEQDIDPNQKITVSIVGLPIKFEIRARLLCGF